MKTILVATDAPFWRQNRGSFVRISTLLRHLVRHGFRVSFFYLDNLSAEELHELRSTFGEEMIISPAKEHLAVRIQKRLKIKLRWYLSRLHHLATGQSVPNFPELGLRDSYSKIQQNRFRQLCARLHPDFVLVETVRLAYLVDGLQPYLPNHTRTLIDTHDVMHLRCQRFHEVGERHWINISEEEERQALSHFDAILAIQKRDASIFKGMLPEHQVIVVGHPCDIISTTPSYSNQVTLAFVGSNGPHNRHAIQSFLDLVWPELMLQFADSICMRIFGSVCRVLDSSALPSGVELAGFVEDLSSVYQETDIIVNPVRIGGGLKIKNVEALCFGKPLVTTGIGAEGIEDGEGGAFFVCDDDDEMVNTLAHLIIDSHARRKVGQHALAYARSKFSPVNTYRDLMDFLCGNHPREDCMAKGFGRSGTPESTHQRSLSTNTIDTE